MKPARVLQPGYFDGFHCIGPSCEDTCCTGWVVHIDKATYDKYQECSNAKLAAPLRRLITINPTSSNEDDYARVQLNTEATCPFLREGWCSIQEQLGDDHLSNMCATYPRVINRVGETLQRSLDLSCPEAARLALLHPTPMEFDEKDYHDELIPRQNYPALDLAALKESRPPYDLFREIRQRAISLLQNREQPLWKRLFLLGRLCDRLVLTKEQEEIQDEQLLAECPVNSTLQLETVLELIVARITSDSNPRRFLECYREFVQGIEWTAQSSMREIGARYAHAYAEHYLPFMSGHEHILENYLVNYVHRTLFPFSLPESNQRLRRDNVPAITAQYMLLAAHYSITKTILIGMAAFHRAAFDTSHAVKLLQSCAKTFEHSVAFPGHVMEILSSKGMSTPASLCFLIRN